MSKFEPAALYLQDKGRTPTVYGIKEYFGTGSHTTLAAQLKKWKDTQQDGAGHIPKQLANVAAGLWDQLQEQANSRTAAQQSVFDAERSELRKALAEAKSDTMKQERLFSETQQQLDNARNQAVDLAKKLQEASQSCDRFRIMNETALKRLDDAKAENQRPHDLSRQIRKNLEHYQEAIHPQKTSAGKKSGNQANRQVQRRRTLAKPHHPNLSFHIRKPS